MKLFKGALGAALAAVFADDVARTQQTISELRVVDRARRRLCPYSPQHEVALFIEPECPNCAGHMQVLLQSLRVLDMKALHVYGVGMDEAQVQRFAQQNGSSVLADMGRLHFAPFAREDFAEMVPGKDVPLPTCWPLAL